MEDIEVPDDSAAETPASPESEELSAPEESAAAGEDAQAEDDDQTDTREEEGSEDSPEQGPGGAFDKLLAKYGGDKEKMASAYFEQANSNSRLWEKLQGIEEYIKGQQQPKVNEEELVAKDPDVSEVVKEYNDTQAEIQATTKRQDQLISAYGKLERTIENLKGQLERASDYDVKAEIREKLVEAQAEQKANQTEIAGTQRDVKRLSADLKKLTRDYREAVERAKATVSRQRQLELERQQEAQATRREFAEAMRAEANRYGISVESKQYAVLFQSINDRIYSYLSRLPDGAPGVDIGGAVKALMEEYGETLGLKARFQKSSAAKREATTSSSKTNLSAMAKQAAKDQPKDGRWTKAFAEERARRMLGG